ncbi:Transcription factor e(y)2 [Popillia japonica]|uniref:Enhancer of yellow 2 transcription factor n=1 Tax=Popillia japonica TaxID=7064 RepID=A0AAW1KH74_POPJA
MTLDFKEEKVNIYLESNNALERVSELVQTRLVDCGWRDQVRLACRKAITENGNKIPTVDELVTKITPKARSMVPDPVKRELLHELEMVLVNVDKASYNKT